MNTKRLLLAEDDQMLATLLKYRLELGGYQVDLAKDGQLVRSYLDQQLPDILVSDILMPYYSGIELVGYLRNELHSEVPVILMSKAGSGTHLQDPGDVGADDFISKPVSPEELLNRVDKLMKNRKL